MRKLLASSTFAIAGALDSLARKLERQLGKDKEAREKLEQEISEDYEEYDQTADEWEDDAAPPELLTGDDIANIEREIGDLRRFRDLAVSIAENSKGQALLSALRAGFVKALELGSAEKAIIFTESRRTQEYLVRLLSANGYDGKLVLFNGSNSDSQSKEIYKAWIERHKGTDRVTGSRTADIRAALVDYFREKASIMIATEAAAEGINLQFCSMVVNYDLPWNPQRIEQRIGRCHRYGQRYDVVVVNFLNKNNLVQQLELHVDHLDAESTPDDIAYEILLKAGFRLSTEIETIELAGSDVFSIEHGALLICLAKEITPELIDAIAEANPLQVICLDEGFKGNDQLKANAVQTFKARAQAEESEIVFKTV